MCPGYLPPWVAGTFPWSTSHHRLARWCPNVQGMDEGAGRGTIRPVTEPVPPAPRFLTLDDVAAELSISRSQTYALVRAGDLPALKIGGRGQWRVERTDLETYIDTVKRDTAAWVAEHPFTAADGDIDEPIG